MAITTITLNNTFDEWRTRTNQLITQSNYYETNLPNYTYANNIGVTANAFASATIAGANTAVGAGANAYSTAASVGANAYATAVGAGVNAYMIAVQNGSNTAVGAGANAYAVSVGAGANAYMIAVQNGSNTAVGAGANAYACTTISGVSTTLNAGIAGANANAASASYLTSGTVSSARISGSYTGITGVGTLTAGTWNAGTIPVLYGGTGQTTIGGIQSALGLASMAYQASSSVSISGGSISGLSSLAVSGAITATGDITAFSSDARLKGDIQTITDALSKVNLITGITYKHNDLAKSFGYTDENRFAGVLAQEVEVVLPEVVVPAPFDIGINEDGTEYSKSGENYKTVKYEKIVPLLIEAIKELSIQVESMKLEIEELKK